MINEKKAILIHKDNLEILDSLTTEEAGRLFLQIYHYTCKGKAIKYDRQDSLIFIPFKKQIDRDDRKYILTCKKNKENGQFGGRPRTTQSVYDKPKEPSRLIDKPKKPSGLIQNPKNPVDIKGTKIEDLLSKEHYWKLIDKLKSIVIDNKFMLQTELEDEFNYEITFMQEFYKDLQKRGLNKCVTENQIAKLREILEKWEKFPVTI